MVMAAICHHGNQSAPRDGIFLDFEAKPAYIWSMSSNNVKKSHMPGKILSEIKDFNKDTKIRKIFVNDDGYPYVFLGDTFLGWAEYSDFSAFNPFEILGFTVVCYNVDTDAYVRSGGYEWLVDDVLAEGRDFIDTLNAVDDLSPLLKVREIKA
jgi:hypothetical protein